MEIWRKRNTSTYISFPLLSSTGVNIAGAASLDSEYLHWSDVSVPCAFSDMGDETRSVADGIYVLGVAAAEIDYQYVYIEVKSDIGLTQNILIRTNVQDPSNVAYAPDAVSIMSAIAKVQIDVTSTLAQVGVMSTSVMRDITSLVVGVTSMMIVTKSALSNTIAINTAVLSAAVATKSAWSNTNAIVVSSASLLSNVNAVLARQTSHMIGTYSALSNTLAILGNLTSMYVAVQSAWSNTVALGVGVNSAISSLLSLDVAQKSILSNIAAVYVDTTSTLANLKPFNASTAIGIASLISSVLALDVGVASLLVNVAAITPSDPAATAQAVWEYTVSQASTTGMAGEYLMDAGAAGDPALIAAEVWGWDMSQMSAVETAGGLLWSAATSTGGAGETGDSIASAVWGHVVPISAIVAIKSALSNTLSIKVDTTSIAISATSLIVGVTSMMIAVKSALSNTIAINLGVLSAAVAVKSTWSNTIAINTAVLSSAIAVKSTWSNTNAILVSTASLLVNVADVDSDLATVAGNVTTVLGGTTSISINVSSLLVNVANLLGVTHMSTIADYVWDEILTGATHNIATSAGRIVRAIGSNEITAGTVVSALNNSIELAAGESAVDNYFDPSIILIDSGTGVGQSRRIIQYNGATKVATVQREWRTLPVAGSTYIIFADGGLLDLNDGAVVAATSTTVTLNSVSESVSETYAGATIAIMAGTGKGQMRVIESYDGATKIATIHGAWATTPAVGDAYVIVPTGRSIVAGFLDGIMTTTVMDATMDLTTAQKAAVNAEVLDVLNVDTFAEPGQEAPAATASLVKKIGFLYKNWRNRKTATSTAIAIYADNATTVDQRAVQSDDGVTYDKNEIGTGP